MRTNEKSQIFGLDIGKINICGDKMVTRCHLEIRVFSSSSKRWLFEEFWHFGTRENEAILGVSMRGSMRSGWLVGLVGKNHYIVLIILCPRACGIRQFR